MSESKTSFGLYAQNKVRYWLKIHGVESHLVSYKSPYDFLLSVGRHRVEVKASEFGGKRWTFNIHRHGVVDESEVDFYILRLEGSPKILGFSSAIHLILEAPLDTPTITISPRSLLAIWGRHYNQFDLIKK